MKGFAACIGLLAAFFIVACDWEVSGIKNFDYDLRGTWESNDPSVYSGKLVIDYDRITIIGYDGSQTQNQPGLDKDDNKRPFKEFVKGIALKGYSEGGKIFIEDGGLLQEGIPYTYWDDNPPPSYKKIKFLRFNFGGRAETMQSQ